MMATLNDTAQSWVLQPDGEYSRLVPQAHEAFFSSHDYFMLHPSLSGRGSHRDDVDGTGAGHEATPHRHRIFQESDL